MRWVWILAGLGIVYLTATSLASSYVTATITARPMVLVRGDTRVPVWLPQTMAETQPAGTARMSVGTGAILGVRMGYLLPDGGQVSCWHAPFWVRSAASAAVSFRAADCGRRLHSTSGRRAARAVQHTAGGLTN